MKTNTIQRVYHVQSFKLKKPRIPFVGDIVVFKGCNFFVSEFVPHQKYRPKTCDGIPESCDFSFHGLVHFGPFVVSFDSLSFIGWSFYGSRDNSRYATWRFNQ